MAQLRQPLSRTKVSKLIPREWELFYQYDTTEDGCGGTGEGSSGRAECAAACLALEDSLTHLVFGFWFVMPPHS